MDLMTLIRERHTDFVALCRSHKVSKICAFGSSITDHFDPETSDIDIVVTILTTRPTVGKLCFHYGINSKLFLTER